MLGAATAAGAALVLLFGYVTSGPEDTPHNGGEYFGFGIFLIAMLIPLSIGWIVALVRAVLLIWGQRLSAMVAKKPKPQLWA